MFAAYSVPIVFKVPVNKLLMKQGRLIYKLVAILAMPVLFVVPTAFTKQQSPETLQSASPFPVGAAVDPGLLQKSAAYRHLVETEFNSITAENVLKFAGVHPAENKFDFTRGDILLQFSQTHHKRFHGHNLCWYQYNPAWVKNFQGDSAAWEQMFKQHIQTVVSHYKGKIASWDVVNEAFYDDGTLRVEDTNPNDKKDDGCIWARHLGKDYIARAFKYAHEADPNALLFYNDYNQEIHPAKLQSCISMVNDFKKRGIPINGIGLQMHVTIATPNEGIANTFKQCAATGLQVHISELDIRVNTKDDSTLIYTSALQKAQADKYLNVVTQYETLVPNGQQFGITTWNVGDSDSWIRHFYNKADWPLLFDDSYNKKQTYYAFLTALKNYAKRL